MVLLHALTILHATPSHIEMSPSWLDAPSQLQAFSHKYFTFQEQPALLPRFEPGGQQNANAQLWCTSCSIRVIARDKEPTSSSPYLHWYAVSRCLQDSLSVPRILTQMLHAELPALLPTIEHCRPYDQMAAMVGFFICVTAEDRRNERHYPSDLITPPSCLLKVQVGEHDTNHNTLIRGREF